MVTPEPASAIVARVPIPPALERLRRHWDLAAGHGVPAHVTVLFPFLLADALLPKMRRDLAAVARAHQPFVIRFERIDRFPGAVYVAPEPAAPFIRLTEAFVARFPEFPPYGGAFAEVIPHLTVVESEVAPLDEIAASATRALPFRHRVAALEVLVEGGEGRWQTRWRLPLGVRP